MHALAEVFRHVLTNARRYAAPKKEPKSMVNLVMVSGTLPRDAELRTGGKACAFTVCCEQKWAGGEVRKEFISCVAFGQQMPLCEHLRKGDHVLVEGRLETRAVEKDGAKKYYTNVVVKTVDVVGTQPGGNDEPF